MSVNEMFCRFDIACIKIGKFNLQNLLLFCILLEGNITDMSWILVLALTVPLVAANMNFYLPATEVEDLFGADGMELFYIRNGVINHNAINFMARVAESKQSMNFIWEAMDSDISVLYDMSFLYERSKTVIEPPHASINKSGKLPNQEKKFHIDLKCIGNETKNVEVQISFKFRFSNNPTEVIAVQLHRLKKCVNIVHKHTNSNPGSSNSNSSIHGGGNNPSNRAPAQPLDPSQGTHAFYISISVVTFVIILSVVGVRVCHIRSSRQHRKAEAETYVMSHISGGPNHNQFLKPDLPNNATAPHSGPGSSTSWMNFTPIINDLGTDIIEVRTKLSAIAIPESDVVLEEMLQEGTFSKIYRGTYEGNCPVLVKTVTEAASEEQTRLLLFESSLLRGMQHRNLLPIKKVVLDGPKPPMVIFPYTKGGNLKRYLCDIKFTDINSFGTLSSNRRNYEQASTQDLVEMGIQVACGMAFLARRGLVHKDLATRNCVIDENLKVKITDNALSRDLFPADYCCLGDNENRPVRWLAMESLVHKVYSTASDVWSFGVLLWELQSLGATPYNDIDDFEMSVYLQDGFRLSQPINCPDHLYNIMARCWHYSSDKRPTFSELLQMLMEFNAELGEYV